MKLYTEDQVRNMLEHTDVLSNEGISYYINEMKPIELPSDDNHIEEAANRANGYNVYAKETKAPIFNEGFKEGVNWMIKKIKQQKDDSRTD